MTFQFQEFCICIALKLFLDLLVEDHWVWDTFGLTTHGKFFTLLVEDWDSCWSFYFNLVVWEGLLGGFGLLCSRLSLELLEMFEFIDRSFWSCVCVSVCNYWLLPSPRLWGLLCSAFALFFKFEFEEFLDHHMLLFVLLFYLFFSGSLIFNKILTIFPTFYMPSKTNWLPLRTFLGLRIYCVRGSWIKLRIVSPMLTLAIIFTLIPFFVKTVLFIKFKATLIPIIINISGRFLVSSS